jgi:16S rRNA processing protein RimM
MTEKYVEIGRLAGAFSLQGEVKFVSFFNPPEKAFDVKQWHNDGKTLTLEVVKWRVITGGFAVRFKGITDRTQAEAIKKQVVYIPYKALPDIDDDEDDFYYADLIGMTVALSSTGQVLGTVEHVDNFGASDVIEFRLSDDHPTGAGETIMIPFTKEAVPDIDEEKNTLTVADGFVVSLLPKGFVLT